MGCLIPSSGGYLYIFSTTKGIGISPDSVVYIEAAQNLASGKGLVNVAIKSDILKINFYAPLFPVILAGFNLLGVSPSSAARMLNLIFWCASILIFGVILRTLTGSKWIFPLACALITGSVNMFSVYTMAWTEPCFMFLGFLSFYFFIKYIKRHELSKLFASALVISLAFLCRYAGITLVATETLGIYFFTPVFSIKRKVRDLLLFMSISSLPTFIWLGWGFFQQGDIAQRKFVYHPVKVQHLLSFWKTIEFWLVPHRMPAMLRNFTVVMFLLLLLGGVIWIFRREDRDASIHSCWVKLPLIFVGIYLAFIGFSISFLDAHIPVENRTLLPVWSALMILTAYLLWQFYTFIPNVVFRRFLLFVVITFTAVNFARTLVTAVEFHKEGIQYNSDSWKRMQILKDLPKKFIYSNAPDAIYFLSKRKAAMLPYKINPMTLETNPFYKEKLEEIVENVIKGRCVIVYLDRISWRWYLPTKEEILAKGDLMPIFYPGEGTIIRSTQ